MYIHVSPYRNTWRVRILRKVTVDGVRKEKLVEHIGSAGNKTDLLFLKEKARQRIIELRPQLNLLNGLPDPSADPDPRPLELRDPFAYGLWQIMGGIYDQIGLPDNLLKYLVLARIALPESKRATVRYLGDNLRTDVTLTDVYRFMDSLSKDKLMSVLLAYAQTKTQAVTGDQGVSVVFYDVTTLYFEANEDDEDILDPKTGEVMTTGLRKKGYSKDHRYDLPQVVVGLTVDSNGFPLDFSVYGGNTYEGYTLLDGIEKIRTKLKLDSGKLTVVADAGMLSNANLKKLESSGYNYIVGARIKSLAADIAESILTHNYAEKGNLDATLDGRRMVVTYSQKRAERSQKNRERLVKKLQAKLDHNQVVKKSKYVLLTSDKKLQGIIDQAKLKADARFDGLKGYVTNTTLTAPEVIAHYGNLWHVEKSFRMSKSDLRARPTFHFKRERVIAHLVICVCALATLKEFEQQLNSSIPATGLSIALEQLLSMRAYKAFLNGKTEMASITELTDVQRSLLKLK